MARLNLAHVYRLGIKELWSLWRDPMMLVLIAYTFSISIYVAATAMPDTLNASNECADSVFIGRFFRPLRASVTLIAGIFAMERARFAVTTAASALVWAAGLLAPGIVGVRLFS